MIAAVLHRLEMLAANDADVAGHRAEDVADLGGLLHRHHPEAVHHRFQRPQRIDLGDDDLRAHAARALRQTPAAPAVAGDHEVLPGEQLVRRAQDAVERALARAVAVVEEVLCVGVIDGDDRVRQHAVLLPSRAGG